VRRRGRFRASWRGSCPAAVGDVDASRVGRVGAAGSDGAEVFVERVGDEVLDGVSAAVGGLLGDLLGWTLAAERGDLRRIRRGADCCADLRDRLRNDP